jgi:hypothetical protein
MRIEPEIPLAVQADVRAFASLTHSRERQSK